MKLNLIQRGTWHPNKNDADFIPEYLYGRNGLFDLDYMGAAEFEFGALPKALRYIYEHKECFGLHRTNLTNRNGVPFYIFAEIDEILQVTEAIKTYLDSPYYTQEMTDLDKAFSSEPFTYIEDSKGNKKILPYQRLNTHFWWDIQNNWMGFFAAERELRLFTIAIRNQYEIMKG